MKVENYPWVAFAFIALMLVFVAFTTSCSLLPNADDVGGIIDKSGKAITTVQIANTGKSLADTRKLKIKADIKLAKGIIQLIDKQPIDKQPELIMSHNETQVQLAENTYYKGFMLGGILTWIFIVIVRIAVFLFNRFKPLAKKETKEF